MENKRKHLELIQVIINRLAGNLFFLKGWTITLVTALFALSGKETNLRYGFIAYLLVIIFWVLDAYFLSKERQFRCLYNDVRKLSENDIDFSMDISKYIKISKNNLPSSLFSVTLMSFYLSLLVMMVLVRTYK